MTDTQGRLMVEWPADSRRAQDHRMIEWAARIICASENEIWEEVSDAQKARYVREALAAPLRQALASLEKGALKYPELTAHADDLRAFLKKFEKGEK